MGISFRRKHDRINEVIADMRTVSGKSIRIGVFGEDNYKYGNDADLVTIASVHEFGANIRPVKGKWLTIPIVPEAKGKRASDFGDLKFIPGKSPDYAHLARVNGKQRTNVFLLLKEVNIPERSFLRTGFDENIARINQTIEQHVDRVLQLGVDPNVFINAVGMEFAGLIQRHMKNISSPPNSPITTAVKQSSSPLRDTGRLIGAIRHKIE